ncbi:MAG: engB [Chlamydiia bacterium]|nr:engB [Chlamydiia bacterium]
MLEFPWNTASFIKSAELPADYTKICDAHGKVLKEVAVVGRSNVGKSSLLNDLFAIKRLAKVSSTPGKTILINFFRVKDFFAVVDLPGYGYAKVSKELQKEWGKNIQQYLEKRVELSTIIFLLDIRRTPNEDDLLFFEWASFHQKNLILVLTKTDKVKSQEKKKNRDLIFSYLPDKAIPWVYYSIKTHEGQFELRKLLLKTYGIT